MNGGAFVVVAKGGNDVISDEIVKRADGCATVFIYMDLTRWSLS
jgi:hypothetical protein